MNSTHIENIEAVSRIEAIHKILEVVCRSTGLGFAAVAHVTETRWIACVVRDEISFGLEPGNELPIQTTLCEEVRRRGEAIVIDHAAKDLCFAQHPTPMMYGFQSYISVPIVRSDGSFFGTLCAIDPRPASLNKLETIDMFKLFANLISFHLDALDQLQTSEAALLQERQTAQLREEFLAIVGHDLRNPINAMSGGAELLLAMDLPQEAVSLTLLMKRSAARMTGLVENLLDFARARLGDGLSLNYASNDHLDAALEQVIVEVRIAWPNRTVESDIVLRQPVHCDTAHIAQLFSNLLANAMTHSADNSPVWIYARSEANCFELSVVNFGEPIPKESFERLFQPYKRATDRSGQKGLGLGLYIASEIAHAHQGTLEVESTSLETRFTFRMPNLGSTGA